MKTAQVRFIFNAEVWLNVSPDEDFKSFHDKMQLTELEKIINRNDANVFIYEVHEFDDRMDVVK